MTWNIHGAVGRNPRFDLGGVIELVKRHAPDIVALQEVDSRRERGAPEDPFDALRQALGAHAVAAHTVATDDGAYGQALISRWPLGDTRIHDLSYPEREPRRAVSTRIETPAGPVRVVATHLGLTMRERRSQGAALLDLVRPVETTTVALGDFNDWLWAGSVHRRLARALPALTAHRTYPACLPLFRLDRILYVAARRSGRELDRSRGATPLGPLAGHCRHPAGSVLQRRSKIAVIGNDFATERSLDDVAGSDEVVVDISVPGAIPATAPLAGDPVLVVRPGSLFADKRPRKQGAEPSYKTHPANPTLLETLAFDLA